MIWIIPLSRFNETIPYQNVVEMI